MKVKNTLFRIFVFTLIVGFSANAHAAFNRNKVFSELEKIQTNWEDISIDLSINDFDKDVHPGVVIGEELTYRVKTDKPAYFVFILVDAKGNTAVLKPDALSGNGITGANQSLTFPSDEDRASGRNKITQGTPLGKETIFLLASDQYIGVDVFGLDDLTDYTDFGKDLGEIRALVSDISQYTKDMKLKIARYEYFVDSDTQISTRGIRREMSDRLDDPDVTVAPVKLAEAVASVKSDSAEGPAVDSPVVFNDIQFDYNSDVLTDRGISQLEVLGSELIDRQEQDELPRILLTGHTDSYGSAEYNMDLSKRRSMASKRFLVEELGLPADYIDTHGMGETAPLEANDTKSNRARNRRVEFEIVK